jgi:hypothetical protein
VGRYQAVLLDWRGVVALDPEPSWWVMRALASLGRHIDPEVWTRRLPVSPQQVRSPRSWRSGRVVVPCTAAVSQTGPVVGRRAAPGRTLLGCPGWPASPTPAQAGRRSEPR